MNPPGGHMPATVALIGVSGFAQYHCQNLTQFALEGRIRLAAATIINPEQEEAKCRALRSLGCELFADYREMLACWAGRLDLCVIPTGIPEHAAMTIAALAAGSNVLVEKPAAGSLQDVDAMIAAQAKCQRFVAVAFQQLYLPETLAAKRAILAGQLGDGLVARGVGLWPRSSRYYLRNNWAGKMRSGGRWVLDTPFNNAFAHPLNLFCFLAGTEELRSGLPARIQAELYRSRPIESLDTACLRIETATGAMGMFWLTHSCQENRDLIFEISGSRGALVWTSTGIFLRAADGTLSAFGPVRDLAESTKIVLRTAIEKLARPETFVCDLEIARMHTICSNGAIDSSPIRSIPSEFLTPKDAGADFSVISQVEEACLLGFQTHKLWSELNLPWTRPSEPISLRGYSAFLARHVAPSSTAALAPLPAEASSLAPME
jgi:predicted dehydrogenase